MQYSQCATPIGVGYMCVAGSGGGTRYARLPPVIEVIPRSGYLIPQTDASPIQPIPLSVAIPVKYKVDI